MICCTNQKNEASLVPSAANCSSFNSFSSLKLIISRRQNIFIRKGGSGDWKNYFTHDQSDQLDAMYRKYLTGTIAEHWWTEEMTWDNNEEDSGIEADLSSMSIAEECTSGSSTSSRRDSLENFREEFIETADDFNLLKTTIQKYIPWRERVSSQSSSGYNSLSSSLY